MVVWSGIICCMMESYRTGWYSLRLWYASCRGQRQKSSQQRTLVLCVCKGSEPCFSKEAWLQKQRQRKRQKLKRVLWICVELWCQQHKSSQQKIKERQKEMRGTICVYIYTLCTCVKKILKKSSATFSNT